MHFTSVWYNLQSPFGEHYRFCSVMALVLKTLSIDMYAEVTNVAILGLV